jgi:hypothetical protein
MCALVSDINTKFNKLILIDDIEDNIINSINSKRFIVCLYQCFYEYINSGARSSKKVNILHNFIKNELEALLPKIFTVKLEQNIKSMNASGKKRCDIIIYKDKKEIVIIPVKFMMSNFNQNKNNAWENLTGEIMHLLWANPNIKIIPMNIIFNNIPYLDKNKKIKKFEIINYNNIFKTMEILTEKKIILNTINYIIDVLQNCEIGTLYNKIPTIICYNKDTPHKSFSDIFSFLIQ